jgi:energy-coupling factor transporter ATP-binding protein EcfA2
MQLTLKNIGIVGDATVKLNGLTVVTGANNSGKTTVGRAVYSLVSAVENLQRNAVLDKLAYVQSVIASLLDPIFFRSFLMEQDAVTGDARMVSIEDIIGFIDQVCKKVVATEKSFFEQNLKSLGISASPSKVEKIFQDFLKRQPAIVDDLKSLRNAMLKDSDCREYASKRIEKKFSTEFYGQISPLSAPPVDGNSVCILTRGGIDVFNVSLGKNTGKVEYKSSENPLGNAFFLDDGSVVDELSEKKEQYTRHSRVWGYPRYSRMMTNNKEFLGSFSVEGHRDDLIRGLLATQDTITGELAVARDTEVIMGKIREAVAFGVEWRDGRFVSSDFKIDLHNLAQGSKAFLVIKLLLENGQLRKDSLLVLDEPETRLHPEWQSLFAEVVVLLIKHLGCTVLLTTHSPDFVIALDVAVREHGINEKATFYISNKLESGLVTFDEVDDDVDGGKTMNDVYLHLSKKFLELEPKRLSLTLVEQEEEVSGE